MTRKNAAAVYFTEELENEIQERGLQHIFLSKIRTREDVMKKNDCLRKIELYEHKGEDCSPLCKSKGCSNLRVIDSCGKVCMCHCMFAVPMEIDGYPLLTFQMCAPKNQRPDQYSVENITSCWKDTRSPPKKKTFWNF